MFKRVFLGLFLFLLIAVGVNATVTGWPPATAGTFFYWKFDEPSGAVSSDRTKGTFDFNEVGTVPTAAGKIGLSRGPCSAANYFRTNICQIPMGGTACSLNAIEGWFNTSGAGTYWIHGQEKVSVSCGFRITMSGGHISYTYMNAVIDYTITSTGHYNDGAWHYLFAANRESGASEGRLYIDNTLIGTANGILIGFGTPSYCFFGHEIGGGAYDFVGLLDEWAYWGDFGGASWTTLEEWIAARWNGGLGQSYPVNMPTSSGYDFTKKDFWNKAIYKKGL